MKRSILVDTHRADKSVPSKNVFVIQDMLATPWLSTPVNYLRIRFPKCYRKLGTTKGGIEVNINGFQQDN